MIPCRAMGDSPSTWRNDTRLSASFLLVACLALRVMGLVRPCLSDDEATYCVVAREMLAGRILYRDVVDHKPPLIYATYAATQAIGGRVGGMRLLHLITALVVFLTALLVGRLARTPERGRATPTGWPPHEQERAREREREQKDDGFFAALLYIVFTTTLLDFDALAANCELFMMLPLTASVVLYLRAAGGHQPFSAMLAVGTLTGVAILYKYQAAVNLPLYALHWALVNRRRPARLLAGWGALTAGLAAVMAASLLVLRGFDAVGPAWFWFRFNFAYISQGLNGSEIWHRLERVAYGVVPASLLWILGIRAVLKMFRRDGATLVREDRRLLIAGWLFASMMATTAGGRFFGHYFHQVTAPLAVLAASGAARLWRRRPGLISVSMIVPALTFFIMGVLHQSVMVLAGEPDPDYQAIAAFVDAHSTPADRLIVWGNVPVLYFEANRPLGSRFVFSNYLTGLSPATSTQSDPAADASANVVAESWTMLEADLRDRQPALFVDTSAGNIAAYGKFPPVRYPRLQAILDRDYRPIGEVAGARVFARHHPKMD